MTVFVDDTDFVLHVGDALEVLRQMPDESVHMVCTSPPYWGLRDYGTGSWDGGNDGCDHLVRNDPKTETSTLGGSKATTGHQREGFKNSCPRCGARRTDHQLGLEPTPDEYVTSMVAVFREVRRVLRRDGTCWLNIGDSYAQTSGRTDRKETREGDSRGVGGTETSVETRPLDGSAGSGSAGSPAGSGRGTRRGGEPSGHSGTGLVGRGAEFKDRGHARGYDAGSNWANYGSRIGEARNTAVSGLKPKDLCMIPARLAMALQAPYYTGEIRSEMDRAWLAAVVDSEGCIYISRSKAGTTTGRDRKYVRTQDAFDVGVKITNTNRALLERVVEIVGYGNIREQKNNGQQAYDWTAYSSKARQLLAELYPHLVAKKHEARLAIGCPPSGEDARKAHESLKAIHQGQTPHIDFAPPEGMWERGWFLRSEIIWAKLCRTPCLNP